MLRLLTVALCALTSALANAEGVSVGPRESEPETHTVLVGWSGSKFTQNVTHAKVGDVVEFSFYPPDHSVVQAHYEQGCIPFESAGGGKPGFYSGPQIVSGASDENPTFRVEINDTEPIFFYCGAKGSCKDKHMIGAINPNKTQTLEGHLGFVEQAEFQLLPGEDWPSEAPDDEGGDAKSGSGSASALANSTGSSPSLSSGAIAGIVIGGAAVLIAAAALIYLCGRRGGKDHACGRSLPVPWGNGGSRAPASPFGFGSGVEQESAPPMSMGTGQEWSPRLVSPALGGPGYAIAAQQQAFGVPVGPHLTGTSVSGDSRTVSQITASPPPQTPLAELPASQDPGNSPLPVYRQFSWKQGGEAEYRAGK